MQLVATERMYTQGNLQQTDNSKDVAINGNGFFQVQMPDGTTAYTRDGSFQTNAQGQLVTASGYPVSRTITIPQNATGVYDRQRRHGQRHGAGSDHRRRSVRCRWPRSSTRPACEPQGREPATPKPTRRARRTYDARPERRRALQQGYVETSNVNVVEELVNMIQTQRAYEINSKAVQTSDQMLQTLSQMSV